ncbi:HTH_Tnp_Tc3_2 domain-containing protein [Trichonephila clavipes]|nr:HTH_Tnp_Tc3_2 domain-containing protein [Trichonephila clavipes]
MEDSERWGALKQDSRSQVCCSFLRRSSFCNFTFMETIPNHTDIVRRPVGGRPRVTTPAEDQYIAIVAKRNRRATSTRVTSMVTASIGKAISAPPTVREHYT